MTTPDLPANRKYGRLVARLGEISRVAVAFSGGVDSTLLLAAALAAPAEKVLVLHARTPLQAAGEHQQAVRLARDLGCQPLVMDIDPYGWPEFVANPRHRCYLCKKQIYTLFQARAAEHGAALLDGTNHDDLGDDRPGLRALAELAVHTPLAEVGLTKAEIRHQARLLGLPNWDKPSASCLATRVMDGQPITVDRIRVVAQGEEFLAGLHFRGSRFRHHGRHCRLEVRAEDGWRLEQDDIWSKVHSFCRTMGFTTIKSGVRPGNGS